jgi:RNA polymerase sigma-70 factor (ECF subfamily)
MADPGGGRRFELDLAQFRSGDEAYFDLLVRRFGGDVRRMVFTFTTDSMEAEDLFQEVWVRVWRKRDLYRPSGSFRAWLVTLSRNVCIVARRKTQRERTRMDRARQEDEVETEIRREADLDRLLAESEEDSAGRALRRLAGLSAREREAVVLRIMTGLSGPEAAEEMGVSASTVRVLVHRGLTKLRKELATDG